LLAKNQELADDEGHRVHSIVSREVIASYAQKLNLHALCERAASGQLLYLG
jgi:hypothetical protein